MYQNGSLHNIDTGYVSSLRAGAYCEHILTEGCLIPHEPHENNNYDCVEYVIRNRNACYRQVASGYKILEGLVKSGCRENFATKKPLTQPTRPPTAMAIRITSQIGITGRSGNIFVA